MFIRAPKHYAFLSNISMCLFMCCWFSQYCYQVSILNDVDYVINDYTTYLALNVSGGSLFILSYLLGIGRSCSQANALFWSQLCCLVFGQTLITIGMAFGQSSQDVFGTIDFSFNLPADLFVGICAIFLQSLQNCYEHQLVEEAAK